MTQSVDCLIDARYIIPIEPANCVLEHHTLAIDNGQIIALLPSAKAHATYSSNQQTQLNQHIVLPGLINAHGHGAMSLLRGYADDLPLMIWLNDHIWPAEGRFVDPDFVRTGTELAIAELLLNGVTTFSDMYFHCDVVAKCALNIGIRAYICCPIIDFPSSYAQNGEEYLHKALELFDQYRHNPMIEILFGPHSPYAVSEPILKRLTTVVNELDAKVHIHLHETSQEVNDSLQQYGIRPIERLDQLGLLGPNLHAVHMTQTTDHDIELLKNNHCHVIHCPESNLKLASGFCPVAKLQDHDINVALGTDGPASNNDLNLLGELHTAALLAKAVAQDARCLPAFKALELVTINGAKAYGVDEQLGSLTPGKQADITAVKLHELTSRPLFDAASHLVYTQNHQVSHVWVNGKLLVNNGQLLTVDVEGLKTKVDQYTLKINSHRS